MKLNLDKIYHVYLVGIGGIGMSALARYFRSLRIAVAGYDLTESKLTKELEDQGIEIHYTDSIELIPSKITQEQKYSLVIYTPAIPQNNKELNWLRNEGCTVLKRSEVLGLISEKYKTIAVAGTHGKTTTSSMIAHVMNESEVKCNAFLGGIATNFNSNLVLNDKAEYAIIEADEFDRSFLTLKPNIAVVTSTDADHLDIYGEETLHESFQLFVNNIVDGGKLFIQAELTLDYNDKKGYSVANTNTDIYANNIRVVNGDFVFDSYTLNGEIIDIKLGINGLHNIENALATIAVCQEVGIDNETIKKALNSYKGVKRRFEYHIKDDQLVFIDDYAHHPSEIKALVSSVKKLYPNKKITGVFQPHLFSRTRDFANDFATELSKLDEIILLDIYPARELPIEGINSAMMLEKITNSNKELVKKQELIETIKDRKLEVLLTIGAGDIDGLVEPIKNALLNKKETLSFGKRFGR
jgi:UDP-N-acetylmuramate--alanine ligase